MLRPSSIVSKVAVPTSGLSSEMWMMNSLKGDLGRLRPGLRRLCSHSDPTHVHVPTITGNSESLRLIIIIFSLLSFALLDLSFTLDNITLTTWPISTPCLLVMNHIEHLSKLSTMIRFSTYSITVTPMPLDEDESYDGIFRRRKRDCESCQWWYSWYRLVQVCQKW